MLVANVQVTGSCLEDADITNESLDLALAVNSGVLLKNRRATMKYLLDQEPLGSDEDHDQGEQMGFCVFGKKIYIYGNDGLFFS